MMPSVIRSALKWGLVLGVAVVVWTLALHAIGFYTTRIAYGLIADNVATILPLASVLAALLEYRRRSGAFTIREALLIGFLTGIVSAPISVGFLWVYHHYINPGWVDYLVQHLRAKAAAGTLDAAAVEATINNLRRGASDGAQATAGIIGSTLICTLSGLLGGVFLRRARERR
jgi:hypothetical protein